MSSPPPRDFAKLVGLDSVFSLGKKDIDMAGQPKAEPEIENFVYALLPSRPIKYASTLT
jgi:hypothetical protein